MAAEQEPAPQKRLERVRQLPDEHKKRIIRIWTILGLLGIVMLWAMLQLTITPLLPEKEQPEKIIDETLNEQLNQAPSVFSGAREALDQGIEQIQYLINQENQPETSTPHLQPAADIMASSSATTTSTTTASTTSS